jgi:hypothetical protein
VNGIGSPPYFGLAGPRHSVKQHTGKPVAGKAESARTGLAVTPPSVSQSVSQSVS